MQKIKVRHFKMYDKFLEEIEKFIFIDDKPEVADIIFVPGNGYPQMAENAAALYNAGYASRILPSGKYSISSGQFSGVLANSEKYNNKYSTEWEFLRDVLKKNGVHSEDILREDGATYTWENAQFSRKITDKYGLDIKKAILCCKNYHARRALMYYQRAYPDTDFIVCSSCVDGIKSDNWTQTGEGINEVIGEVNRIVKQFSLMM